MPKMLQVCNVFDRLYRELTRRARKAGRSLTDYVQEILEREVARPLAEEVFARIAGRPTVDLGRPAAAILRDERGARKAS